MDPNATLTELRELAEHVGDCDRNNCRQCDDAAPRLAELVQALDEWITRGGFLPAAWRDTAPAVGPCCAFHASGGRRTYACGPDVAGPGAAVHPAAGLMVGDRVRFVDAEATGTVGMSAVGTVAGITGDRVHVSLGRDGGRPIVTCYRRELERVQS